MQINKLIKGEYYRYNIGNVNIYFKFDHYISMDGYYYMLYSSGFYIIENVYYESVLREVLPNTEYYSFDFEDIVECLPDSNIDKRNYLRTQKIKYLLN